MNDETIETALARLMGVDPSQVAWLLGEAARTAGTVADAPALGRALLDRLEAMRAQGGALRAVGPDDADVERRLRAIEAGREDPGPLGPHR